MKKIVIAVSCLFVLGLASFFVAPSAKAVATTGMTVDQLQSLIVGLQQQIAALQAQLAQMQGGATAWCHTFNTNLRYGDSGSEVSALITALIKEGFLASTDSGTYFSEKVASAVVEFQEKYASEILTPLGLRRGTGVLASATRAKLNKLYGCGTTCIQVVTYAKNLITGECKMFSTPCDVPSGWVKVSSCDTTTCTDSDGGLNYYVKGTVTYGNTINTDVCSASGYLFEQKCINGAPAQATYSCPNGCSDGACITASTTPSITVLSPNGGEQWIIGNTYPVTWKSSGLPDDAQNRISIGLILKGTESALKNFISLIGVTANDGSENMTIPTSLAAGYYRVQVEYCPSTGGTCDIKDYSDNYISIVSNTAGACVDSDGGLNYNVKGTVTYGNTINTDTCSASGYLFEQKCINGIPAQATYLCPNGCSDGACITVSTTPSITVLSPNGGESWVIGNANTIKWSSTGNIPLVDITTTEVPSRYIAYSIPNTGSFAWTIPSSFSPGQYKLQIAEPTGGPSKGIDQSDNYFSIVSAQTPLTCDQIRSASATYFDICKNNSYDKVCFNKYTSVYQGCGKVAWGNSCTVNNANAANNIWCDSGYAVVQPGSFTAAMDTTKTPYSQGVITPSTGVFLGAVKIYASVEDMKFKQTILTSDVAGSINNSVSSITLYDSNGTTQLSSPVAVNSGVFAINASDLLADIVFTKNVYRTIIIKGNPVGTATDYFLKFAGASDITLTGVSSGANVSRGSISLSNAIQGKFTFSPSVFEIKKNATSPSGTPARGTTQTYAIWDVVNPTADDMTITGLTLTSKTGLPSSVTASMFRLVDGNDTVITPQAISANPSTGNVVFSTSLAIPAASLKSLKLQIDTTNTTVWTNGIQMQWTINSAANVTSAAKVGYGGTIWSIPADCNLVSVGSATAINTTIVPENMLANISKIIADLLKTIQGMQNP